MTEIIAHIPYNLQKAIKSIADSNHTSVDEAFREAVVDFVLKQQTKQQLNYDDSDEDMLKNLMASTSITLFQEENAGN